MSMKGRIGLRIPSETGVEQPGFSLFKLANVPVIVWLLVVQVCGKRYSNE
jgi:hypothetical protein